MPSRVFTVLGRVLGLVALVLLVVTVTLVVREQRFRAASVTAVGTVTEVVAVGVRCDEEDEDDPGTDPDGRSCRTVYSSRVSFVAADGSTRTFLSGTASWPPEHAEGETVTVRHRPSDPGSARVDQSGPGLSVLVLGVLTVAFGVFALLWTVLGRRARSWAG